MKKNLLLLLFLLVGVGMVKAADAVELKTYTVPGDRIPWYELKAGDAIVLQNATGTWVTDAKGTFKYANCKYRVLEEVFLTGSVGKMKAGWLDVTNDTLSEDNVYVLVEAQPMRDEHDAFYLKHRASGQYITCTTSGTSLTADVNSATAFELSGTDGLPGHAQWTATGCVDEFTLVLTHYEGETEYRFGPFWNYGWSYYGTAKDIVVWNVFGEPRQDASAYINLKKLMNQITQAAQQFPAGSEPGYYPVDLVDAYEIALMNARSALDMEEGEDAYLKAFQALKPAYEAIVKGMTPLADGFYYIQSTYSMFPTERNVTPYMLGKKDGFAYWDDPKTTDPNYVFKITRLESGNYSIMNYGLGTYLDKTYDSKQYVEFKEVPTVEQIIASRGDGSWRLGNTAMNARPYYPDANGYGKGVNGHIGQNSTSETWCGWKFIPVPQHIVDSLGEVVKQLALTQQLDNLIDPAVTTYNACFAYDKDLDHPLLSKYSDDPAESQVTVNHKTPMETLDNSIAYLNDNDYSTILDTYGYTDDVYSIDGAYAIYADLEDRPVQKFVFKMSKSTLDNNGQNRRPVGLTVYARDNAEEPWIKIESVNLTGESAIIDAYSNGIDMGKPYRYVRFDIDHTYGDSPNYGKIYYAISEFQMYPAVLNEEYSQYSYSPGLKEACDALLAQMNHAREAVANNNATQEDYENLAAAIAAVKPLIADTATLYAAITNANTYANTYGVGEDYGQVSAEQFEQYSNTIADINNFDHFKPVKSDLNERVEKVAEALALFQSRQITIQDGAWYYISNMDTTRTGDTASIYATKVYGNVIYAPTANTVDKKMETDVDELWHGLYDRDNDALVNPFLANSMWRAVAMGDTAFAFQNRATGTYMGKLCVNAGNGLSAEPVPYYVRFAGVGQYTITCADTLNVESRPLHASGEGRLKTWAGGRNSASAWTFLPTEDVDEVVEFAMTNNTANILTFPFEPKSMVLLNPDFQFYTLKNMPDANTVELTLIDEDATIEAGQPVVMIVGNVEDFDSTNVETISLVTEIPTEYVTEGKTVNGLVGVLNGDSITRAGYGYFNASVLDATLPGTFINGQSGYINPTLVQDAGTAVDLTLKSDNPITGVKGITVVPSKAQTNVYTIDGKLVKKNVSGINATKNLNKGIYLVGKKKVAIP